MPEPGKSSAAQTRAITPYITVKRGAEAIDFYKKVLGATEVLRLTDDEGRIGHASLKIGDAELFLSDEHPEIQVLAPDTIGGTAVALYIHVKDVDAVAKNAAAAGAKIERPPADQPHGDRMCVLFDPFGHRWMVATPKEAVSDAQMRERYETGGYKVKTGDR